MLENIRIILVEPSHPGNIGAVARALKNMGLGELFLVKPKKFPDAEAYYRASGADEILARATVTATLTEALTGCSVVFGTSARSREMPQPLLNAREAASKIMTEFAAAKTAIVFGPERTGLENEDLMKCHYHVQIPTVDNFSSLNLAMAVQVVAYELFMANLINKNITAIAQQSPNLATADQLEGLFQHIEQAMIHLEFLDPNKPRKLMQRIRRIIHRAHIDRDDLDLLRGIMAAIQKLETRN